MSLDYILRDSEFTLSDLERSDSRSLRFRSHTSHLGSELGHILLLKTDRKSNMGSSVVPSHLTLGKFERSKARSFKFLSLLSQEGA